MDNPQFTTIYVTKYWKTHGIILAQAEETAGDRVMKVLLSSGSYTFFSGQDWHPTFEAAVARVQKVADAERKVMEKAHKTMEKDLKVMEKALKDMDKKVAKATASPVGIDVAFPLA